MQELTTNVTVDFKPGNIKLENSELLKNAVMDLANKYKDLIITDETIKDDKKTKTELNGLLKQLEDKRKEYKKQFQIPLKEFENTIKEIESPLNDAIDNLKVQLNDYDERYTKQKEQDIRLFIEEVCINHKASSDDIEINPKLLNKSTSKKSWQEQVMQSIKLQDAEVIRFETEVENVKAFAEQLNVNPDSYVYQVKMGASSIEVVRRMQLDVERNNKRQESIQAQMKAEQEAKKARTKVINNRKIDTETGEVENIIKYQLVVAGTLEQLRALNTFLCDNDIQLVARTEVK